MSDKDTFKDHFSGASGDYQRSRPNYPPALFTYLAAQAPGHTAAWDCATGTGQAAQLLARHFDKVIATDGSTTQIASAAPHPAIDYRVALAESSGLANHSIDLITVAQALHWFDIPAFYLEVKRVLKPHGVLAILSYNLLTIEPAIDAVINHLYGPVLDNYWPPERLLVENGYRDIPFPFHELAAPPFAMTSDWTLDQLLGYLRTWSAVRRYQQANGSDPVFATEEALLPLWGERTTRRQVTWPLTLRQGVVD